MVGSVVGCTVGAAVRVGCVVGWVAGTVVVVVGTAVVAAGLTIVAVEAAAGPHLLVAVGFAYCSGLAVGGSVVVEQVGC